MPADRWFGVGSCGGAQELAGARAVDDALIHDDPKLLIVFCSPAPTFGNCCGRSVNGQATSP